MTTEERIDQILTELLADYKRVSTYRVARAKQQLMELMKPSTPVCFCHCHHKGQCGAEYGVHPGTCQHCQEGGL
jgi:hypothetical protein